jgi:quercetin dioxygenase-like cupin family protein
VRSFDLDRATTFSESAHVERILLTQGEGDMSVACWEPGQISPYHCHPQATEAYLCVSGGGTMRTPTEQVALRPGTLVVHPSGELHEYENGAQRSVLFRVRYGDDVTSFELDRRGDPGWRQPARDAEYFRQHPPPPERPLG